MSSFITDYIKATLNGLRKFNYRYIRVKYMHMDVTIIIKVEVMNAGESAGMGGAERGPGRAKKMASYPRPKILLVSP